MKSLAEAKEFHDPDTAGSSGGSHVPRQPVIVTSSREMHGRDSGLPTTSRDTTGNSGNVSGNAASGIKIKETPNCLFTVQKAEIAKYALRTKITNFAEDALAKQYREQKSSVT